MDSASFSSTYSISYASYAIDGDISGTVAHSMCTEEGPQSLTIYFKSRSCIKVSTFSNKILDFEEMAGPSIAVDYYLLDAVISRCCIFL